MGCFRNFPFTAQQPKRQNSCSQMWPIEQLYIELGSHSKQPYIKNSLFMHKLYLALWDQNCIFTYLNMTENETLKLQGLATLNLTYKVSKSKESKF